MEIFSSYFDIIVCYRIVINVTDYFHNIFHMHNMVIKKLRVFTIVNMLQIFVIIIIIIFYYFF
jgi:hypothetical protein